MSTQVESGIAVEGANATEVTGTVEKKRPEGTKAFIKWYMERYATKTMAEMAREYGIQQTSFQAKVSNLRSDLAKIPAEDGGPFRLPLAKRPTNVKRKKRVNTLAAAAAELNLERLLNDRPPVAQTQAEPDTGVTVATVEQGADEEE